MSVSLELRAFLKPGLAGTVATADGERRPEAARVWAARQVTGQDAVEIYVIRRSSEKVLANVARGARAAVNLIDVPTYKSRGFKGKCTVSTAPIDAAFLDECRRAANAAFAAVGLGPDAVERMLAHHGELEMVALHVEVDSVFDQSPKPGAGAPL